MIPTRVPQQVITNQSLMLTPQMKINLGILSRLNLGMKHVVVLNSTVNPVVRLLIMMKCSNIENHAKNCLGKN